MANVTFYVCAHQDDWQLFRGQYAYSDITAGAASGDWVVFVYVTAGDARGDFGPGWSGARELGALESCRSVTGPKPLVWSVKLITTASATNRPITRCECGNTRSYFLRLPDARLEELRAGTASLQAVDGSTTYGTWADLCDTLGAILESEKQMAGASRPWVNTSDYDVDPSLHSNPDHLAVGYAVQAASSVGFNRAWWADYYVEDMPANLDAADVQRKVNLQRAYTDRVLTVTTDAGAPIDDWAAHGQLYTTWMERDYARSDAGG